MCVLAFAWAAHPRWRMVMIGNRDELHARPTAPLARWEEHSHLIAGRDLQSGGSWLALSEEGRFAVVTNVPNPDGPHPDKVSRGALVADAASGIGLYAKPAEIDLDHFNPVNLITVDVDEACFLSNRSGPKRQRLASGIYGLSNGALDESWPKTNRIKGMLEQWLTSDSSDNEILLDNLRENDAPQVQAGQASQSPIFIRNPVYGTRCSTVVAVEANGTGWISERRYDADGEAAGETTINFNWPLTAQ